MIVRAGSWVAFLLMAAACSTVQPREPAIRLESARDSVDGATLHYVRGGSGPPLLLLHGFMWSATAWERFADTLGRHYSLIIPDLPGHGYSNGLPETWSPARVAHQVSQLLDHLGLQHVRAIGCSAGSDILMHMAMQQPDRLERMILISPSHRLSDDVRRGLRSLPPAEQLTEWRTWNEANSPRGAPQVRELLDLLRGLADNRDDYAMPLDRFRTISVPAMIVAGDQDGGPSLETVLELHRTLARSSLWVVPQSGHCPVWGDIPGGSREAEKAFLGIAVPFLASAK